MRPLPLWAAVTTIIYNLAVAVAAIRVALSAEHGPTAMTGPVLVTGGAGFIGSALVRFLIAETDEQVVNVDKLTYAGNLESLEQVAGNSRYRFEHVDICDGAALRDVFARHQPRAVMHLAAESHVDRSIDRPSDFIATNLVGTATLLMVAQEYLHELDGGAGTRVPFPARLDR